MPTATKTKRMRRKAVETTWPDHMGPKEVAEFLGVKRPTVQQWSYRKVLPPRDFTIGKQPVWTRPTVIAWAVFTGRLAADDPRAGSDDPEVVQAAIDRLSATG